MLELESPPAGRSAAAGAANLLQAYLRAYWLRPENALWMTLRSLCLHEAGFAAYAADLSCGDGVFSFLHAGGRFQPEFDVFQAVAHLDRVTDQHADMFDCSVERYAPPIARRADRALGLGTDLKPNLLKKAAALGCYANLLQHDSNMSLPLADESLGSVYCNSAYWIANIDAFLADLRRVTQPGGNVILQIKLDAMRAYTFERFESQLGRRLLDIPGRGRMDCWPTLASRATWERRFAAAGLRIAGEQTLATRTHAHLWDVGLRPIAPLLVRMAEALTPATRAEIKRDWVALLSEMLAPLAKTSVDLFRGDGEPAEVQYVLAVQP